MNNAKAFCSKYLFGILIYLLMGDIAYGLYYAEIIGSPLPSYRWFVNVGGFADYYGTGNVSRLYCEWYKPDLTLYRPDGTWVFKGISPHYTRDLGNSDYAYGWDLSMPIPATPTGFQAGNTNASCVNLNWNASNGGIFPVTYAIYRAGGKIAETNGLAYADTNKATGPISYQVMASTERGASSLSTSVTGAFFGAIISINPTSRSFLKESGGGSVLVEAASIVKWDATTAMPWIALNSSQTNGTGNGTVSYVVSANTTADSRIGTINIGDKVHTVNQSGHDAQISPTETNLNFFALTCQVAAMAPEGVSWTSVSLTPWIQVVSGQSGTGNGTTGYRVSANTNLETRIGTLRIAGQVHTVNQTGVPTIVTPTVTNMPQAGGAFSFTVFALASTAWTATTNVPWLHFVSSPNGTGNVIMAGYVDSNPSYLQRSGFVDASGARCVVVQQGVANPVFNINPINATAVSTGAFGYVAISATPDAPWSARSLTGWLILAAPTNGAGDGMISYVASVNNSIYARTGTVAFAAPGSTKTHSVVQAGHVGILSPASQQFTANGGSASTELSIHSMCSWTSTVPQAWIQITANNSGVGSRQVSYAVSQNNTVYDRTGTVQIAGQPLTVVQAGRNAQIDVESRLFDTDGGMGEVNVATEGSAYWETVNPAGWISIFQGITNNGNGKVIYIVSPYGETLSQRTAVLTIAGQQHFVTQVGYTATIDPDVRNLMAEGGLGSVMVNSPFGANWQAVPSANWIQIADGQSSNAPGLVSYVVAPNLGGADRAGAIFVAGKKHTINQSAALGGDVLPYQWEKDHWPQGDSGGATNDFDADGFTNWQEWRAGTDPRNKQSYFHFEQKGNVVPGGVVVVWPSITGRTYSIYRSLNLMATPAFSNIAGGVQGQAGFTSHTDTTVTANGPHIYRIGVEQ